MQKSRDALLMLKGVDMGGATILMAVDGKR